MTLQYTLLRLVILVFTTSSILHGKVRAKPARPNIILIVADDLGYGDLASYGHPTQEWNVLDRMTSEGIRFTHFYSTSTFCTPSRAALLTGRLPVRLGMSGHFPVFLTSHSTGLPKSEVTVAELLRDSGYNTGMVGKWHLGINEFNATDGRHLPDKHGFNFVGTNLPFSLETVCDETGRHRKQPRTSRCFLYRQRTLVQQPLSMSNLTATLVEDARVFLHDHAERREADPNHEQHFFLYLSMPQPHTPMFNDPRFRGRSARGQYGDQILELAWAVEETLETLNNLGVERDTLVMFLSDHGPHREMCSEGGSTGPLRGGKGNLYEGGIRVPAFIWWPGHIEPQPATPTLSSITDVFLTLADFADTSLPVGLKTDGISLRPIIQPTRNQPTVVPERKALFFYCSRRLTAVRYAGYKIHFWKQRLVEETGFSHCVNGISEVDYYEDFQCDGHSELKPPTVYNVHSDPGERFPLAGKEAEQILREVDILVSRHREDLVIPKEQLFDLEYMNPSLIPCCNPPYCVCQ